MEKITPMLKQYIEIKEKYKDAILFFRLGDFYEMFLEDAIKSSQILNIALTSRNGIPMCGVPHHASEPYIKKLLDAGYKVAICEQVEDPKKSKGIVKREVTRVITPGTFIETEQGEKLHEFVMCIKTSKNRWGAAAASVSTGKLIVYEEKRDKIIAFISNVQPKTIIIENKNLLPANITEDVYVDIPPDWIDEESAKDIVENHFGRNISSLGLKNKKLAIISVATLIYYLREILMCNIDHIKRCEIFSPEGTMYLDDNAIRHLEIFKNFKGEEKNSLFSIMDKTKTNMGKRLLKEFLSTPLTDPDKIERRLQAVSELTEKFMSFNKELEKISDIERITSRISGNIAKPRELISLKESLKSVKNIKKELKQAETSLLIEIGTNIKDMEDIIELVEKAICDDENMKIKYGYNEELDRLRNIKNNFNKWLKDYEEKQKKETNIPSLKIGYNKIFGYYIEVTKTHLKNVPKHYIRKQTLVSSERFITEELKKVEEEVLNATIKIEELERNLYKDVLNSIKAKTEELQEIARLIGTIDVLCSFAELAVEKNYIKPKIVSDGRIAIVKGRHPVIESISTDDFIPNDTIITPDAPIHIITGPNMSGKSTYIRQTALIVLMAQIGSFVPAGSAFITPVDRILTRIGTADNIAEGHSTFMVEMIETANILNSATDRSLIILDEIGRGTSTYDGLAIAWATVEYIKDKIKAKTLFATHYHELTELADIHPEIKNFCAEVKEFGGKIIFTHRIRPGRADKSYGIYVADIAGIPKEVIERANQILKKFEEKDRKDGLPLYEHPALVKLKLLNINKVTPIEAYMILEELKSLVHS